MATYTPNYNLEKPAQTDIYNIDVFNANADKIDTALAEKAEQTMLAPVEKTNIASQNYVKDAYFVYNGYLCIATAPIAMGGTIAIGTNCASTAAGTELKSIKESLSNWIRFESTQVTDQTAPANAVMGVTYSAPNISGYTWYIRNVYMTMPSLAVTEYRQNACYIRNFAAAAVNFTLTIQWMGIKNSV